MMHGMLTDGARRWRTQLSACAACAVALLAGCADVTTDPKAGGLAGGINGLVTGAYDQRIADRQASLDRLNDAEAALVARAGSAEGKLRAVDKQIAQRKSAIERLRADIAEIDRSIEKARRLRAISGGMEASARAANARREQDLAPLLAQRDLLKRMTDDLEAVERQSAIVATQGYAGGMGGNAGARSEAGASRGASPGVGGGAAGAQADAQAAEALKIAATLKAETAKLER